MKDNQRSTDIIIWSFILIMCIHSLKNHVISNREIERLQVENKTLKISNKWLKIKISRDSLFHLMLQEAVKRDAEERQEQEVEVINNLKIN